MPGPPLNRINPYNPLWPQFFEALRQRLAPALADISFGIEHVGSTAVPGLSARPVIDAVLAVPSEDDIPEVIDRLALVGYRHRETLGIPGSGLSDFLPPTDIGYHHLYLVVMNSPRQRRLVSLRDYLRRHPEEVQAFNRLKRAFLARPSSFDAPGYAAANAAYLEELAGRIDDM